MRVKKLKNGKGADKDEVTEEMVKVVGMMWWWTGFGSCVIWPLRVMLCLKT